jgi:DNA-binding MarR family transcriptional regulator
MSDNDLAGQAAQLELLMPRVMRQLSRLDLQNPTTHLPQAQLRVCAILADGSLTISVLAREIGVSVSAATQLADRLESADLVERVPGTRDRRRKQLRLTDNGRKLMRSRRQRRIRRAGQMLAQLSPDRRAALLAALEELLHAGRAAPTAGDSRAPAAELQR